MKNGKFCVRKARGQWPDRLGRTLWEAYWGNKVLDRRWTGTHTQARRLFREEGETGR